LCSYTRLELGRARPERGAGVDQPLDHQFRKVDACRTALHEGDLNDAPLFRRSGIVAVDILTTDHVEDNVGAAAGGRFLDCDDEILLAIVDRAHRSEFATNAAFFLRARRGDDLGAELRGELDRGRADA